MKGSRKFWLVISIFLIIGVAFAVGAIYMFCSFALYYFETGGATVDLSKRAQNATIIGIGELALAFIFIGSASRWISTTKPANRVVLAVCPSCGALNGGEADICAKCGKPLNSGYVDSARSDLQ